MSQISTISRDEETGCRIGRCGDWYVRVRRGGSAYDLSLSLERWEEMLTGMTLDQAARMLGLPQGELYDWGRG